MDRACSVAGDQVPQARVITAVSLDEPSQGTGVLAIAGGLRLLGQHRTWPAKKVDSRFPATVAVFEGVLLIGDWHVIQVDLADYPATLDGQLDGVFDIDARQRVIRVAPLEEPLIMLEYLPPVAEEVDAEFALVEVALDAEPAVDTAVSLAKCGAAAFVADLLAWLLPVAALVAGVRRVVFLVDLDVGGDLLRAGPAAVDDVPLVAPAAGDAGLDADALDPQLKWPIRQDPAVDPAEDAAQVLGVALEPFGVPGLEPADLDARAVLAGV